MAGAYILENNWGKGGAGMSSIGIWVKISNKRKIRRGKV
jgi:hypothetical protein